MMRHLERGRFLLRLARGLMALMLAWVVSGWGAGPPAGKIKVFLLAGQSNMDGRADGGQLTDAERVRLAGVTSRVFLAYNHGPVLPLQLTDASPSVAQDFGVSHVFGPELFFGMAMAEAWPDQRILLIKRSKGGSSLYGRWHPEWDPDRARVMEEGDKPALYPDFLAYIRSVLSGYPPETYELCAVLWVQGEQDSGVSRYGTLPAASYGANLEQLIRALRRDLGAKELPFLLLQVGSGKVVEGMRHVAATVPRVSLLTGSRDLESPDFWPENQPPQEHFSYEGMKRIGQKFADVYLRDYAPVAEPSDTGL